MHNDRMNRVLARGLAVLLSAMLLVGCSGSGSGDNTGNPDPSTSTSGSQSTTPSATEPSPTETYLPVPPGVDLTAQGSKLALGDHAVGAFELRKDVVGALDIQVNRLEQTTFKQSFKGWKLDSATKKSTPFFVHVTVKNVGDTDLGGRGVSPPLYIVDGKNTLIESSSFASEFKPCPSTPLPKKFGHGDKATVCLVFLSPDKGQLTAVSFRPTETFNPIVWTGAIQALTDKPKKGKGGKGKGNG
ncbi:MAG: hypothetical protein JWM79_778 [Nocardioides sp.]|nr:hypothetical protein [Nocardioides sp.]